MNKINILTLVLLITIGIGLLVATPVNAFWDDDTWVAHERSIQSDWDSVLELECFMALDDAPIVFKADTMGVVNFDNQCEDIAFQLRDRAWHTLETEILTPYEYNRIYRHAPGENIYHVVNKAVIGNEVWLVDKLEKRIWFYLYLD